MTYHSRKSPRMANYDYSGENYYFVTICTAEKKCIFGTPGQLNRLGQIAWMDMNDIPQHYENIRVDSFVIMPNHVHAIIEIQCVASEEKRKSLDTVIGLYKAGVSRKIRMLYPDMKVWQRSFHDHVIRNQRQYEKIWNYVTYNHRKWDSDCFNPNNFDREYPQ